MTKTTKLIVTVLVLVAIAVLAVVVIKAPTSEGNKLTAESTETVEAATAESL